MASKNSRWPRRNSIFLHFHIRRQWFPAHHRDRLVFFIMSIYLSNGLSSLSRLFILKKVQRTYRIQTSIRLQDGAEKLRVTMTGCHSMSGSPDLARIEVRLAPNGTNLGLFKISFSTFWHPAWTENWSLKVPDLSHLVPIWPQFGPNLANLT